MKLDVDRLPSAALQVLLLDQASFGDAAARAPQRHDYHELIWTRRGTGAHEIDGQEVPVEPGTVTVIGRGQVHVFRSGHGLDGAVVRFGGELLLADGWLLGRRATHNISVPDGDAPRVQAVIEALAAETRRPPDARTVDLERHLLSTLLLWLERFDDAAEGPDDLHRRFVALLERDFADHNDPGHYADALQTPPAALARVLREVTGRATKDLITDRRLLEAARLLRFTDLSVSQVAHRTGYADPLYFSRAFKAHRGQAPLAYRESMHPRKASI